MKVVIEEVERKDNFVFTRWPASRRTRPGPPGRGRAGRSPGRPACSPGAGRS